MSYRQHTIVRFKTRVMSCPTRLKMSAWRHFAGNLRVRLVLLASQSISGTLVCDRFRCKWKHLPVVFKIVCDKTDTDSFRSCRRPLQIIAWFTEMKYLFIYLFIEFNIQNAYNLQRYYFIILFSKFT